MLAVLAEMSHAENPDHKCGEKAFEALDLDRDGRLNKWEFVGWYNKLLADARDPDGKAVPPPSSRQLMRVFVRGMLPTIGFGFCDNALMILFGEYIDSTIGRKFMLSTMAAAGLGNMLSCATGVLTGGFIERFASKFGVPSPQLTPAQTESRSVKNHHVAGSLLGISVGCLIGMFPLLFMPNERKEMAEALEHCHVTPDMGVVCEGGPVSGSAAGGGPKREGDR